VTLLRDVVPKMCVAADEAGPCYNKFWSNKNLHDSVSMTQPGQRLPRRTRHCSRESASPSARFSASGDVIPLAVKRPNFVCSFHSTWRCTFCEHAENAFEYFSPQPCADNSHELCILKHAPLVKIRGVCLFMCAPRRPLVGEGWPNACSSC